MKNNISGITNEDDFRSVDDARFYRDVKDWDVMKELFLILFKIILLIFVIDPLGKNSIS